MVLGMIMYRASQGLITLMVVLTTCGLTGANDFENLSCPQGLPEFACYSDHPRKLEPNLVALLMTTQLSQTAPRMVRRQKSTEGQVREIWAAYSAFGY
jgi:hypothetical protein